MRRKLTIFLYGENIVGRSGVGKFRVAVADSFPWVATCSGSSYTTTTRPTSVSVATSVVRLSRVTSRKLSEIGTKFRHPHRKSGSESKNMSSNFAPEEAKWPQNRPKNHNSVKQCAGLLSCSVKRCSLFCTKYCYILAVKRKLLNVRIGKASG